MLDNIGINAILLCIAFSFMGSREDSNADQQTETQHTISMTGDIPDHHAG